MTKIVQSDVSQFEILAKPYYNNKIMEKVMGKALDG